MVSLAYWLGMTKQSSYYDCSGPLYKQQFPKIIQNVNTSHVNNINLCAQKLRLPYLNFSYLICPIQPDSVYFFKKFDNWFKFLINLGINQVL